MPENDKQPSNNNTPVTPAKQAVAKNPDRKSKRLLQIIVVLVVITAVIGAYAIYKNNGDNNQTGQASYNTAKMEEVKMAGTSAGNGMSFKKPYELKFVSGEETASLNGFIRLGESPKDKNAFVDLARMQALSKTFSSPSLPNAGYIQEVTTSFTQDPSSPGFKNDTVALKTFVDDAFVEPTITVALGPAKEFTNPNITKNAWQIDVYVTDSSGLTPKQTGKLIYVIGNKNNYKFLVTAQESDWDSNSKMWQDVLASLKIDQ